MRNDTHTRVGVPMKRAPLHRVRDPIYRAPPYRVRISMDMVPGAKSLDFLC